MQILKRYPISPFIFAVTAVVSFFFSNYYEAPIQALITCVAYAFLSAGLFWLISHWLIKDQTKSGIFAFFLSAMFFSFQNVVNVLRRFSYKNKDISTIHFWIKNEGQFLVLILLLLFTFLFFFLIIKAKRADQKMSLYLNVFSILLLVSVSVQGLIKVNQYAEEKRLFLDYKKSITKNSISSSFTNKPDIYYIILDGFARSDTLLNIYELDNSGFIDELRTRGFFVANESYANYSQTRSSLASSLNMMYLNQISTTVQSDYTYYYPAYYLIRNSEVERILKAAGYETVSFMSEVSFSDFPEWDSYQKLVYIPNRYTQTFIASTAFSVFINPRLFKWHRDIVSFVIDTIPNIAEREGPQFVFAHIACPHPPFVFSVDGTSPPIDRLYSTLDTDGYLSVGTQEEYKKGYRDQVEYTQKRIINMIDQIINDSEEPFILILQADHGPGLEVNQMDIENSNVKERLAILNAIYFPDQDYHSLYSQISPINTFRVVFSQYLDVEKTLLPDDHYVSNYNTLFDFILVDDRLQ